MHEVPSGTKCFDWVVPEEWNISEARLTGPRGDTLASLSENNLHVVGYSVPIDERMPFTRVKPHLHSIPAMPDAILLQDVDTLGEQGNVVDVSKGYLRNYLIPRKLAQPATKGAIETVRQRQAAAERAAREAVERAQENVNLLNRTVLTIPQQAGADGRLFGSVTVQDIATAVREARGLKIDKRGVHLPEPIKSVGTYMVVVEVVEGVTATIKTMVVAKK